MSTDDIKAAYRAGNSTWEVLHMVVAAGWEYPDAEWKVRVALRLDDEGTAEMARDYLECC